jgi:hypothetical protein
MQLIIPRNNIQDTENLNMNNMPQYTTSEPLARRVQKLWFGGER